VEIIVNGEPREFGDNITLISLIDELNIKVKVMAAAVNMEVVKRDEWDSKILEHGDKIELLHFVGGG
jgi:sulfur carrier protein